LGSLGGGLALFQVTDDEDVLVVEGGRRCGEVEAPAMTSRSSMTISLWCTLRTPVPGLFSNSSTPAAFSICFMISISGPCSGAKIGLMRMLANRNSAGRGSCRSCSSPNRIADDELLVEDRRVQIGPPSTGGPA